jgi:hypothetical protein
LEDRSNSSNFLSLDQSKKWNIDVNSTLKSKKIHFNKN